MRKMNAAEIIKIIEKTVDKKGYDLKERKSVSTDSMYFEISSGKYSLLFRISDHATRKDVITLRTDLKLTPEKVEGFVRNRCRDLSDRKLKGILGI